MPDQHDASSEHALIQEIVEPLSKLPDDPVALAADVHFPVVLRGYDRLAVDAYVKRTAQLVAELQATHSPEAAVRRALERVGEEISGILQRGHDAAEKTTERSRAEAEDRLERARAEARALTEDAQRKVKELDAETDAIWAERRRILADVNMLASQLTELAGSAVERFPAEESAERGGVRDEDPETLQLRSFVDGESSLPPSGAEAQAAAAVNDVEPASPDSGGSMEPPAVHPGHESERTAAHPADDG